MRDGRAANGKRHIKAVRRKRKNAAVTKEQGLYEQRDADRQTRRIRAKENGNQCTSYSMSRRAARQRDVEHHAEKRQGRRNA